MRGVGMAALPGSDWGEEPESGPALARITHVFTHFELRLAIVAGGTAVGEGWWEPVGRLADAGLPTVYRKAVAAVLAQRTQLAA